MRVPPNLPLTSVELRRRHNAAGHCPDRPRCGESVRDAAKAMIHSTRGLSPIGYLPELQSDCAFSRDPKCHRIDTGTVLVTRDRTSKRLCAVVVLVEGFAVKQHVRDVKKFSYHQKNIMIRKDGEPAVRDLMKRVSKPQASKTALEHTPLADSKASGRAERPVRAIEKQTRVLKLAVEQHSGVLSVRHPAFTWSVMHSADVVNRFFVPVDGQTNCEQILEGSYSEVMFEFGQCVLYTVSAKPQGGLRLGTRFVTEEHVIASV